MIYHSVIYHKPRRIQDVIYHKPCRIQDVIHRKPRLVLVSWVFYIQVMIWI